MAKGSSRREKKKHKKTASEALPDDFVETEFGQLARWGRLTKFEGKLDPEAHGQAVRQLLAALPEMKREKETLRGRLAERLSRSNPIDLIARASLLYLMTDPDEYVESQMDNSSAHIEYLALQALAEGRDASGAEDTEGAEDAYADHAVAVECIDIVRELFKLTSTEVTFSAIDAHRQNPSDAGIEHAWRAKVHSLGIRGMGYEEHTRKIVQGCLSPFDLECREIMGFTVSDALAIIASIIDSINERVHQRGLEVGRHRQSLLTQLKRQRRGRKVRENVFGDEFVKLSWPDAVARIDAWIHILMFANSREMMVINPSDIASRASISEEACRAFLDAFMYQPSTYSDKHHKYPVGVHPLTERPVIKVGASYLVPTPSNMLDAIRPRMEDLIAQEPKVWDRYLKSRSVYLERTAADLISGVLPGSKSWLNISWRSSSASSELDGLVAADDVALRLQCKAGRMTASARRGSSDRIKRNLRDLVKSAVSQHVALNNALEGNAASALGFSEQQERALSAPFQFDVVVTLDELTTWATETSRLRELDVLPAGAYIPWVICLADLMAVVDLLDGAQFVHYLIRRIRLEKHGRVSAHDELDWVGNYIHDGLYFDHLFDESADHVRLTSYTDPIDAWYFTRAGLRTVPAPKPSQPLPSRLKRYLHRLEVERPRHWITASIVLLDGDDESRAKWAHFLRLAEAAVAESGASKVASQVFMRRFGATLAFDYRSTDRTFRDALSAYCKAKVDEHDVPIWVAVGHGMSNAAFVILTDESAVNLTEIFTS